MSGGGRPAAVSALAPARPLAARLNTGSSPEDLAADIIELWAALETSLRAMLGGSSLSGQALVREARQREMITLNQAHSLLEFLAARERCDNTAYRPTAADVAAAKDAFAQMESAASGAPSGGSPATVGAAATGSAAGSGFAAARAADAPASAPSSAQEPPVVVRERSGGLPTWGWVAIAAVALALAGVGAYTAMQNRGDDMDKAVRLLADRKVEAARAEFSRIARENPKLAAPHVFLSRIARDEGDITTARSELENAIRLEPESAVAQREMGALLLGQGNYELARNFLIRAARLNPADSAAQGLLGCALIRLGRRDEGMRFMNRAGEGSWSACAR